MEDTEPYLIEEANQQEKLPQPMHNALNQLNLIFTEILKCAMAASTINMQAYISCNRQLETIEEKIKDLKIYLERKIR